MPKAHGRTVVTQIGSRSDLTPEEQAYKRFCKKVFSLDTLWPRITEVAQLSGFNDMWVRDKLEISPAVLKVMHSTNRKSPSMVGEKVSHLALLLGMGEYHTYFTGGRHFDADFSEVWNGHEQKRPHTLVTTGDENLGGHLVRMLEEAGFAARNHTQNQWQAQITAQMRLKIARGEQGLTWIQLSQLLKWLENMHTPVVHTIEFQAMKKILSETPKVLQEKFIAEMQTIEGEAVIPNKIPLKIDSDLATAREVYPTDVAQKIAVNALTAIQSEWGKAQGFVLGEVLRSADIGERILGELRQNSLAHIMSHTMAQRLAETLNLPLEVLLADEIDSRYVKKPQDDDWLGDMMQRSIDCTDPAVKSAVGWNIKTILHLLNQNYGWLVAQTTEPGQDKRGAVVKLTGLRAGRSELKSIDLSKLAEALDVSALDLAVMHSNEKREIVWRKELGDRAINPEPESFEKKAKKSPAPEKVPATDGEERSGKDALQMMLGDSQSEKTTQSADSSVVWDGKKSVTVDTVKLDLREKGKTAPRFFFANFVIRLVKARQMNLKQTMKSAGLGETTIYGIRDCTGSLNQERAEAIARVLEMDVADLFADALSYSSRQSEVPPAEAGEQPIEAPDVSTDSPLPEMDMSLPDGVGPFTPAPEQEVQPLPTGELAAKDFWLLVGKIPSVPGQQLADIGLRAAQGEDVNYLAALAKLVPELSDMNVHVMKMKRANPDVYAVFAGMTLGEIFGSK